MVAIRFPSAGPASMGPTVLSKPWGVSMSPILLVLWAVWFILCAWLLIRMLRWQWLRQMPWLAVYLCFSLARTVILASALVHGSYWYWYWPLQGIGYTISALLALSLCLTPKTDPIHKIDIQFITAGFVLLPWAVRFTSGSWETWLAVAKWSDITAVFIMLCAMVMGRAWTRAEEGIAWGLAAGMAGHMVCSFWQGDQDPTLGMRLGYQLSGLAQAGLWLLYLRNNNGRRCN